MGLDPRKMGFRSSVSDQFHSCVNAWKFAFHVLTFFKIRFSRPAWKPSFLSLSHNSEDKFLELFEHLVANETEVFRHAKCYKTCCILLNKKWLNSYISLTLDGVWSRTNSRLQSSLISTVQCRMYCEVLSKSENSLVTWEQVIAFRKTMEKILLRLGFVCERIMAVLLHPW